MKYLHSFIRSLFVSLKSRQGVFVAGLDLWRLLPTLGPFIILLLSGPTGRWSGESAGGNASNHVVNRLPATELSMIFHASGFDLQAIRRGESSVPRLFFSHLPSDYAAVSETGDRKDLFVKTLLPLVLHANEQIRADRQKMLRMWRQVRGRVSHLSPFQLSWLQSLASRYKTTLDKWPELLRRVDEVPPSLALAQGIVESGWGTASLAWEKNCPFGYRTMTEDGSRLKLHHFKTLPAAVSAYVHNINTHRAYGTLRLKREELRHKTGRTSGHALAEGLQRYSELGQTYIDRLRQVIRQNGLEVFDRARLSYTSV